MNKAMQLKEKLEQLNQQKVALANQVTKIDEDAKAIFNEVIAVAVQTAKEIQSRKDQGELSTEQLRTAIYEQTGLIILLESDLKMLDEPVVGTVVHTEMAKTYSAREVSRLIGLPRGSLNVYLIQMEKHGYQFLKNEMKYRIIDETDFDVIKEIVKYKKLKKIGMMEAIKQYMTNHTKRLQKEAKLKVA